MLPNVEERWNDLAKVLQQILKMSFVSFNRENGDDLKHSKSIKYVPV